MIVLIFTILGTALGYYLGCQKTPEKFTPGWIDIDDLEPPDGYVNIIVSDGKDVDTMFGKSYDKHGNLIMGYDKKIVTHWRHLPGRPE